VSAAQQDRPYLRVVSGAAGAEELAALVAVLSTRSGGPEAAPAEPSRWGRVQVRTPLHPGRGAWRAGALPR